MARGKKFETNKLDETLAALSQVTPKPKNTIKLKELIRGLKPRIKRLRSWDYSWVEIVELLKKQGIEIAEDTLKDYLKTTRRSPKKTQSAAALLPAADQLENRQRWEKKDNDRRQIQMNNLQLVPANEVKLPEEKLTNSPMTEPEPNDYSPIKLTMRK